ncbi:MAG: hypothetical protein FJ312_10645 [SAR202 cluster bacterium]|nr:hypothetical protein [SAR202 cluster bacterium]
MLPSLAIAQYDAALVHLLASNPERALELLDNGDALYDGLGYPDLRAQSLFLRGRAYQITGECDAARDALEESLKLSPKGRFAGNAQRLLEGLTCQ